MTTQAGIMLVTQIAPLIAAAVAKHAVKRIGSEDGSELTADGLALAAKMLDSVEAKGKVVTPGNIAFFAVQALRSGRRSTSASRTDVMSPGTALDGNASLTSLDAPTLCSDEGDDDSVSLYDALADRREGPDVSALRKTDWESIEDALNPQQGRVLFDAARGLRPCDTAEWLNVSRPRITQLRREIGAQIRDVWHDDNPMPTVCDRPAWQRHVAAYRERRACRAERTLR